MAHAGNHSPISEPRDDESSSGEGRKLVDVMDSDQDLSSSGSDQVGDFQNGSPMSAHRIQEIKMEPDVVDTLRLSRRQVELYQALIDMKSESVTASTGNDNDERVGEFQNFYLLDAARGQISDGQLVGVKDEPVPRGFGEEDEQIAISPYDNLRDVARIPEAGIEQAIGNDDGVMSAEVGESDCPMDSMEADDTGDVAARKKIEQQGKLLLDTAQPVMGNQPVLADDGSLQCKLCGKSFSTRRDLQRHVMCHTGEKPHKCEHCGKCFTQKVTLQQHIRCHTGERPYECEHCGSSFTQRAILQHHTLCHTGDSPYKCEHCGKCFTTNTHLQRHLVCHTGEKPHQCHICGKCFTQMASLQQHIMCHTDEKPHKCQQCGKCFTLLRYLKQHILCHSGEKQHECQHCGICFTQKDRLLQHILCHTSETPHMCQHCGKCFTTKGHLQRHILCHNGLKPYQCEHCSSCFAERAGLLLHMLSHTGEKPHKCPHCDKCFSRKDSLQRHVRCHTAERRLKCEAAVDS